MTIIDEINLEGDSRFGRRLNKVKDIALSTTKKVLEDEKSYLFASTIGLMHGLKYTGSLNRGVKAGVSAMGVMIGANVIRNVVINIDEIKNIQ